MAQENNFNKLILLKGFSTYFDRKIFYYSDYEEYEDNSTGFYEQEDINFNPNDGIDASVDLSTLDSQMEEGADALSFSYCIVLDKNEDIVSRWFVMDAVRTTKGIYRFELKRDVVAESIASDKFVGEAPIYVEKAILNDNDPMIVNDEGLRFNQIKTRDILLSTAIEENNESNYCGYIVGYFQNDTPEITATARAAKSATQYTTFSSISAETGIPAATLEAMTTGALPVVVGNFDLNFGVWDGILGHYKLYVAIPSAFTAEQNGSRAAFHSVEPAINWDHSVAKLYGLPTLGFASISYEYLRYFIYQLSDTWTSERAALQNVIQNDIPGEVIITESEYQKLKAFEGQTVLYQGKYFKLAFNTTGEQDHPEVVISEGENSYFDATVSGAISRLKTAYPDIPASNIEELAAWEIYLTYKMVNVSIDISEQQQVYDYSVTIKTSHNILIDAPYSMFVIPYGNIDQVILEAGNPPVVATATPPTKEDALNIASAIAVAMGDHLIDLQLLPFMPQEREFIVYSQNTTNISMRSKVENEDYAKIFNDTPETCGAIFFPTISNFSLSIRYPLSLEHSMKIDSQCCFYRLCSPNYNGVFEFNLAKDGGSILNFLVDCTLKPYNPFIRVSPEFNFLYGNNYKDGRGLICGGDFSLPIISDPWINYQFNNKNFASIFSREIQNLDFTQKQEAFKEKFALGAGIVGGGAAGAVGGAKVGGAWGAIAGAAIGLGAGSVGAYIDSKMNTERRAETKDFALDRFSLGLGNIQAMPNTLAKSSAYNITSKIFPFLEFYTCTDEEVKALENKIKYDGMTVGRIGTLINFMGGNDDPKYFKGQLIRAEGIYEDNHFVSTLYEELAKGVYI